MYVIHTQYIYTIFVYGGFALFSEVFAQYLVNCINFINLLYSYVKYSNMITFYEQDDSEKGMLVMYKIYLFNKSHNNFNNKW